MQHPQTGEDIDLEFRGPFEFMRHVSTSGSPYPTAVYKFHKDAYSYDKKYYAPKGNTVLLACDGNYIVDNSFVRFWSGYLFGKLYNGPIERNPNYDCDDDPFHTVRYDPYGSESEGCDPDSSGGLDGANCTVEWIRVYVWDGASWNVLWQGSATICS